MNQKQEAPKDRNVPTLETRHPWIHAHPPNRNNQKIHKVGKWLLFHDNQTECETTGLTDHDRAWQHMESLVLNNYHNTGIIGAKASTAWAGDRYCTSNSTTGVICCYVGDYTNKLEVKRAADAIRQVIHLSSPIYFKTDEATCAGQYNHLGNKNVSMYMHTPYNDLFERDEFGKWRKL
ncbi:hypothetical protein X975_09315, partial [Stegodyphus mimosarum]